MFALLPRIARSVVFPSVSRSIKTEGNAISKSAKLSPLGTQISSDHSPLLSNSWKVKAPEGYELVWLKDVQSIVAVPDGWFTVKEQNALSTRFTIAKENIVDNEWFDTGCTITQYFFNVEAGIKGISKDLIGNFAHHADLTSNHHEKNNQVHLMIPDIELSKFNLQILNLRHEVLSDDVVWRSIQFVKINHDNEDTVDTFVDANIFGWKKQNRIISVVNEAPVSEYDSAKKYFETMQNNSAFQYQTPECVTFSDVFVDQETPLVENTAAVENTVPKN